jgi:hypothetical protein
MKRFANNVLSVIAKIIAVLCAILFVATTLAALFLFNMERRAFNPNPYKAALANENFYQRLPSILGEVLEKDANESNTPFARQLTSENWATIVQTLLPPEQLRAMTENAITQIFAYLNNETSNPQVSLLALKQRLSGSAGLDAAINLIHAQPDCTAEQVVQLIASFGQVLCNPPQDVLNLAKPILQSQLNATAAEIPDQISLIGADSQSLSLRNLRLARFIMQLSPLIPLALLFGITIFAVRTFKGWLAWWGWPFLIAGVIGAISGFSGAPLFRTALENFILRRTQLTIPSELTDAVRTVMDDVLWKIFQPAGWQALILVGVGLGMLVITFLISQAEKNRRIKRSEAETQIL